MPRLNEASGRFWDRMADSMARLSDVMLQAGLEPDELEAFADQIEDLNEGSSFHLAVIVDKDEGGGTCGDVAEITTPFWRGGSLVYMPLAA